MTHFASFNAMKPSMLQNADRCVFVGDLSFFCTELDLAEAFKHCGSISRLEVKRGRHGDSLLYAFVEFHEHAHAQRAINEMHGVKLLGRKMKVNWTDCKPAPTPGADQWVQVHVNFVSRDLNLKVSEEYLETVFIQFGNIGDIIVKRHSCSSSPAVVSGYAFIYFIDAYAAFRAIHGCKGINMENVTFECALSRQYENAMSNQHGSVPRGFKKNAHSQPPAPAPAAAPAPLPAYHAAHREQQHHMAPPAHHGAPSYPQRRAPAPAPAYAYHEEYHHRPMAPPSSYYPRGGYPHYYDLPPQSHHHHHHQHGGRSPPMVATSFPEDTYYTRKPYDDRHFPAALSLHDHIARDEFLSSSSSLFASSGSSKSHSSGSSSLNLPEEDARMFPNFSSLLFDGGLLNEQRNSMEAM